VLRGLLLERLLLKPMARGGGPPPRIRRGDRMIDTREEILKALRAGPVILRGLVRDVASADLRRRPADGEWAIIEVVAHLADTEERALARTRRMLHEDVPQLAAYDPHALSIERGYLDLDLAGELDRYASLRAETVEVLAGLDDAGWARVGQHGEHGAITVEDLAAHTAGEDADHFAQIGRLIPGIA
jgi:hypothetical protein